MKQDYIKKNDSVLTAEEEKELGMLIAEGGEDVTDAKEELINRNQRLVAFWAKKYTDRGIEYADLIQEGNIGLIKASEKFDYTKGKFSSYASWYIRAAISKAVEKNSKVKTVSLEKKVGNDENTELGDFLFDESERSAEEEIIQNISGNKYSSMYRDIKNMELSDPEERYILTQLLEGTNQEVIRKNLGIGKELFERKIEKLFRRAVDAMEKGGESKQETVDFKPKAKEETSLENLPTGETTYLTDEHDMFNRIFSDYSEDEAEETEDCWIFRKEDFCGSETEKLFLETVRRIRTVPEYKCIVRFLMAQYGMCMSEENIESLWNILEKEEWGAKSKLKDADKELVRRKTGFSEKESIMFSKKEMEHVMNYLSLEVKRDYEKSGIIVKGAWTTYFKKLIYELNAGRLNDMALALHMDIHNYFNFRKKVLKLREKDYLDPTFIYMFLTLKYAEVCGEENLKEAYDKIEGLYRNASVLNTDILNNLDNTGIGKKIAEILDDPNRKKPGKLAENYKDKLFFERIDELGEVVEEISDLKECNTVFAYIVLKYAKQCGLSDKSRAYDFLQNIYIDSKHIYGRTETKFDTSTALGEKLILNLEENGKLKSRYREHLFQEQIGELTVWFEKIDLMKNLEITRSSESVFKRLWKELYMVLEEFEKAQINEMTRRMKGADAHSTAEYKLDDHKIFRFLYGENVETALPNRIKDIEDGEMAVLDHDYPESFLNSKEFLATRINDNKIRNFPKGEKGEKIQRNLLLTLIFLNFVQEPGNLAEDYGDRLSDFEFRVWETLSPCGFMLLHSTSAYDSYLKLLLSSSDPMELFKYVWKRKTKSTI